MYIRTVSEEEYCKLLPEASTRYGSAGFNALNASRCDVMRYFVACDTGGAPLAGFIAGRRDGRWLCPFSAPFGEVVWRHEPSEECVQDFVEELVHYFEPEGGLQLTLPPDFYNDATLTALKTSLSALASRQWNDYNYHYPLSRAAAYGQWLTPPARRNLRRALGAGFEFIPTDDAARVYAVIEEHHRAKGYPVRMTLRQVVDTARVIPTDYFLLEHQGATVAAAIIQHVALNVVQLTYWGNLDGYNTLRPMNMMAYCLCRHYAEAGIGIFDFGPASSEGVPDTGLCRFKTSLGAELGFKPTFVFRGCLIINVTR